MEHAVLREVPDWTEDVILSIGQYLDNHGYEGVHTEATPERFVRYLEHATQGVRQDLKEVLGTRFPGKYDQMIHRSHIRVVSTCKHHLLPFIGIAHFAYLPDKCIIGISKVPRLIRCLAQRLQVQEALGEEIVAAFQDIVAPHGCGLNIRAYHFCEIVRGVEESAAVTETTALRGCFKDNALTREEFLRSINRQEQIFP